VVATVSSAAEAHGPGWATQANLAVIAIYAGAYDQEGWVVCDAARTAGANF